VQNVLGGDEAIARSRIPDIVTAPQSAS